MKKLLSIAFCAAVGSTFASAEVGTVGVTAINSGMANTVIAVSYKDLVSGGEISVSNLVKTTNLTVNDQLAVFENGKYTTWSLKAGDGGAKYWEKNANAYFASGSGLDEDKNTKAASVVTKPVGTGIWLVRQSYGSPFYIYGKPVSNPTSTTVAGKWTLVGNPSQSSAKPVVDGADATDQIVMPGADGKLTYYTYSAKKGWRNSDTHADMPALGAGIGCWVRSSSAKTITWTSAN